VQFGDHGRMCKNNEEEEEEEEVFVVLGGHMRVLTQWL
jgi:hypothetical protein